MFIGINSSDETVNSTLASAKVGDKIEITATITEVNGKRFLADATDAELNEPDEAQEDGGDNDGSGAQDEGGMDMAKGKGDMPKAIMMIGMRPAKK